MSDPATSTEIEIGHPSSSQIRDNVSVVARAILGRLKEDQERSPGLQSMGFVEVERTQESKKGTPTKIYDLTTKGTLAALLIPEVNKAPPQVVVKNGRSNPFLEFGHSLIRKGVSADLVRTVVIDPQVAAIKQGAIDLDLVEEENFIDGSLWTMLWHFITEQFWRQFKPRLDSTGPNWSASRIEDTSLKDLRILRQAVEQEGMHGAFSPFYMRKLVLETQSLMVKYRPLVYWREYSKDPKMPEKLREFNRIYDALVPKEPTVVPRQKRIYLPCPKCKAKIRIIGSPEKVTCPKCGSVWPKIRRSRKRNPKS